MGCLPSIVFIIFLNSILTLLNQAPTMSSTIIRKEEIKVQFQIHVTTAPLAAEQKNDYAALCQKHQLKPLLILLAEGVSINQPMFTYLVEADDLAGAQESLKPILTDFAIKGYPALRIKAEIDPNEEIVTQNSGLYYEWHCKIAAENLPIAQQLCQLHGGHLSQNALRNGERFITIREKERAVFYRQVTQMSNAVKQSPLKILKEKFEYCIYDNHQLLDKGWA